MKKDIKKINKQRNKMTIANLCRFLPHTHERKILLNRKRAFTLVEIMVSVAIFTVVVTAGMGALTNMLHAYRVAQSEKKAADTLSYVLENMTREIRLGFNYYNGQYVDFEGAHTSGQVRNGSYETDEGPLIGFDSSGDRGYMVYYIQNNALWRRHFDSVSGTVKDEALTDASQVIIKTGRVTIMNTENDDLKQPLVWIQFLASTPHQTGSPKIIQTLVSQRDLDVLHN